MGDQSPFAALAETPVGVAFTLVNRFVVERITDFGGFASFR